MYGDFDRETLYRVSLSPAAVRDQRGKHLDMKGVSEVYVYFPRSQSYVRLKAGQGIAERLGKQMIPVEGRGEERLDVRIYPVPPLDRSFWPFAGHPVETDDGRRPPGPGEEPEPFTSTDQSPGTAELARQITGLGSPPVSTLVTLPLKKEGGSASFGLDVTPYLAKLSGKERAGTYLVGVRDVAKGSRRSWMRLQVTDLSLTTIEEPAAVKCIVTSLQSAQPVSNARVRIEGALYDHGKTTWTTLTEGSTDGDGIFRWRAPGSDRSVERALRRIVVEKDKDVLVLDPANPPDVYHDNQWSVDRAPWLQWTQESLEGRGPQPQTVSHIFTDRPVYRPEDEVHIKGYLRKRDRGRLAPVKSTGWLIVEGPGDVSWKYPVTLTEMGSFYHAFTEKDLPTGTYSAHLENQDRTESYGRVTFQMEAYRLPLFEVNLHAPDQVSLDKDFEVKLTASYYAGGKVGGQQVEWRVTQYPFAWTPRKREGFLYSSDGRFSRTERFQASPRIEKQDTTDEDGSASIVLNPALELTAQPRTYMVEATVTGADDQTVTASRSVPALPAFVLGLKVPRYIERAKEIAPEIIVVGPDDALLKDKEVTVRLLRREWHSALKASDFSDGVARYVTDVVDEKVSEMKIKSSAEPVKVNFPVDPGRRVHRRTGSPRQARPRPGRARRPVRGRGPARGLAETDHAGIHGHAGQGQVRSGHEGVPRPAEPLPEGPGARDRRNAGRQQVQLVRCRGRHGCLHGAGGRQLCSAPAGPFHSHARPSARHRAVRRRRHGCGQAGNHGRHGLARGQSRGAPDESGARISPGGAAGRKDQGCRIAEGPCRQTPARRSNALARGPGRAVPGQGAAPRSGPGLHQAGPFASSRSTIRATWLSATCPLRRIPAATKAAEESAAR